MSTQLALPTFLAHTGPQSIKKACQIVTRVSHLILEQRQVFALCAVTTFTFATRFALWGRKVKRCLSNKKQTIKQQTKPPSYYTLSCELYVMLELH